MIYPLISIALATFNGEKFLVQQMDSLLSQDYPNLEIVISDDCSSDRTWEILQHYAVNDDRIKLLPREKNLGYVHNFIRVFMACKGEFISPCDQDDIWYQNKTSRLYESIGDATLTYCNNRFINEHNKSLGKRFSDTVSMISGSDSRNLLFCATVLGHTMLFRRDLLNFNVRLDIAPYIDWILSFLAAENGSIIYLDEVLVDWRQHGDSATAHIRKKLKGSKEKALKADQEHLKACLLIPSKHHDFILVAFLAWNKWVNSYINFSMFRLVIRYGSITHRAHAARFPALKYLLGYKLKKLLRPNHY
ncbi:MULTISPECIES: glycosyltransferase [Acinetobacter]|uniref:Glycosyltransferase n=1 Tax=Acinetobacter bouvetii TaxID=202951 RepID=A0A4Q7B2H5_9GAMM|nr:MULTISPECIES: glycosyltransferase [Acinetobacter]RZG69303.1 glycosyltransferase [Acinetobacter bouvetii]TCB75324.1 glycosyltransferase [Acinetobacter sp. ANC 4177]